MDVTGQFLSSTDNGPVIDAAKMMIYTCLRPSDCLKLRRDDFKQDRDIFYVEKINQKTQKVTSAPIPEAAWHELKDCRWIGLSLRAFRYNLPSILEPYDREATTYEQRGNKIVKIKTTLVEATTPKTLRKVGINRLAEKGVDESVIRDFYSGHSSSRVFNRYYRNQELKKVL
jgi:integrase